MARLSKGERALRERITWNRELDALYNRWQKLPWDLQGNVLAAMIGMMGECSKADLGPTPRLLLASMEMIEARATARNKE